MEEDIPAAVSGAGRKGGRTIRPSASLSEYHTNNNPALRTTRSTAGSFTDQGAGVPAPTSVGVAPAEGSALKFVVTIPKAPADGSSATKPAAPLASVPASSGPEYAASVPGEGIAANVTSSAAQMVLFFEFFRVFVAYPNLLDRTL
jgi:hypothetical protein